MPGFSREGGHGDWSLPPRHKEASDENGKAEPSAHFAEPGETVLDVAKRLSQLGVGALPVCEDGCLVGMITDRDIVVRVLAEEQALDGPVADVMTDDVAYAHQDDDLATLVETMQEKEVRRVPVVDGDSKLVGIVALADLARSNAPASLKVQGLEGVS